MRPKLKIRGLAYYLGGVSRGQAQINHEMVGPIHEGKGLGD